MSIFAVFVVFVLVFLFALAMMEGGLAMVTNFIDLPSLILIVLWTIPVLLCAGMLKDFVVSFRRAFSGKITCTREELQRSMEAVRLAEKANWVAGILGFFVAFVYLCRRVEQMETFFANLAVAVITLIYAAMLNLVLLAVYGRLKKRYMDYMKEL